MNRVAAWMCDHPPRLNQGGVNRESDRFGGKNCTDCPDQNSLGVIEKSSVMARQMRSNSAHPSPLGIFVEPVCTFSKLNQVFNRL